MTDRTEPAGDERYLRMAWWLLLIAGLLGIAAGVIVLAKPDISLATLAVVTGIFLLVDGIFEIGASIGGRTTNRGLVAVLGVITAIVGVMLVRHPIAGVVAIALLLGLWLLTVGIARLIQSFDRAEHRLWNVVLALVEIVAGIVVVASPDIGVKTLALLVGIGFILRGLAMCVAAWALHAVHDEVVSPQGGMGMGAAA